MKLDFTKIKTEEARPNADSMIESFRAVGYTLETAVADILDNSITAEAKNIWIKRKWDGDESTVAIVDDGCGLTADEAKKAMTLGSKNPLHQRESDDLGRFGLGLKTASFSQCRRLTMMSKVKGGAIAAWTWDLDYIDECKEWNLLSWYPEQYAHALDDVESGTCVIWSALDHLVKPGTDYTDEAARQNFIGALDQVREHLSMVFHRFIQDGDITIHWGDTEIEPWDPFCINENKTTPVPADPLEFGDEIVYLQGYILPHKDDFSSTEAYENAGGIHGYPAQQGFYVYRGKRLLLAGDWLGLFRKEEHLKLARIQIDLPNTLDSEWQIDIKKSTAIPPMACRDTLYAYAKAVRKSAQDVFRHRGRVIQARAGHKFQEIWKEKKVGNKVIPVVNRQHAFISLVKELAADNPDKAINMLLTFVEESVPTRNIFYKEAEEEDSTKTDPSDAFMKGIKTAAEMIYRKQRKDGTPPAVVKAALKLEYPFNIYEYIIDELKDE